MPLKKLGMPNKDQKKLTTNKKQKVKNDDESFDKNSLCSTAAETPQFNGVVEDVETENKSRKKLNKLKNNLKKENLETKLMDEVNEENDDNGLIEKFRISAQTASTLANRNIKKLFPIQIKTFDLIFDSFDVIGRANTGTGKTLAFALPVIERLLNQKAFEKSKKGRHPVVLCLLPTRELCQQVCEEFQNLSLSRYDVTCVYGGASEIPQIQNLKRGTDIVVSTPGRTIDLMERKCLVLSNLKVFILDEADQMLEMGFRETVDFILENVKESQEDKNLNIQYLLFSATLPTWIYSIARKFMNEERKKIVDVVKNEIVRSSAGICHLCMQCVYGVRAKTLKDVLALYCVADGRCIIFCETKQQANEIAMNSDIGGICQVIHGDIQQTQRETTLKAFKEGKFRCLVATDVAARGLHIDNVELVIQIDPPKDVDTYIHRAGRTGRAGNSGRCLTYYNPSDIDFLKIIENKGGFKFERVGVPQRDNVILAVVDNIINDSAENKTNEETILKYENAAHRLINEFGALESVCRCLSQILRYNDNSNESSSIRSVISGRENYKTFQILFKNTKIERNAYIWKALKAEFSNHCDIIERFSNMTLLYDGSGAVFDVLVDDLESFNEAIRESNNNAFSISTVSTLPALYDPKMEESEFQNKINFSCLRNPNHRWTNRACERTNKDGRKRSRGGAESFTNNFRNNFAAKKRSLGGYK